MSRRLLILTNDAVRELVTGFARSLPAGTIVEFRDPQRTLDQNKKLWAMLTDVSVQHEHQGRRYDPDDWKVIFLTALGKELRLAPSLMGTGFIPLSTSSSRLSKAEMSDLFEFIFSWGAENGIVWSDPKIADESRLPTRRAA